MRYLVFILLSGCFFFDSDDGLKRCNSGVECAALGTNYSCRSTGGEGAEQLCFPDNPEQAMAMMTVYMNKKAKICFEQGHDFSGVRPKTHKFKIADGCERVWQTKQCRRCLSDVPFDRSSFEGSSCPTNCQ